MAEIVTALFRTESGQLIHMDLPLPEAIAPQVTRGTLVRVNDDGTPYTGEAADASEGAGVTKRPAVNATKAEWVGWAVSQGANADDTEAMTKQDLIERFGA
jgi:hypothetical protein